MKRVYALLIAQVLLTLFAIVKLIDIDGRIDSHETAADRAPSAPTEFVDSQPGQTPIMTSGLHEVTLREIIREELAANTTASLRRAEEENRDSGLQTVDTPEYRYHVERVSQRLDYFESVGEISNREMEELQAEMAKLQAADRRRMFNRLVQSMNSGRIKSLF